MVLGLFLIIIIVILLIPFSLEVNYRRDQKIDQLKIIFWIGILPIKLRMKRIDWLGDRLKAKTKLDVVDATKTGTVFSLEQLKQIISQLPQWAGRLLLIARYFFTEIKKINLKIEYSTGDAALTAISTGAIWSFVSTGLAFISNYIEFITNPEIEIKPLFGAEQFSLHLHCIFRIRLGHIMIKRIKQQANFAKGG